jgi:hypothetical protein
MQLEKCCREVEVARAEFQLASDRYHIWHLELMATQAASEATFPRHCKQYIMLMM